MLAVGSRYEVVGDIGEGGMGAVYRAVDRLTGQLVALKQLTRSPDEPDLNQDTITTQNLALAREFQILAALRHPHIVSVLDYGFTTDEARLPFFTMELLRRPATLVNYGRDRTVDERIDLIAQTLLALMYLHRHSIVHHDLKPGNVLVDQTGTVKLLDFGLSKPVGGQTSAGTLAYMAPELLMGGRSTEASDLYAIGVMAYELFAGERPIIADTVEELIRRVITKMPDYDLLAVTVGHGVAGVIERLLSKDPAGRYQNAAEVIEALRRATGRELPLETSATRESFLAAAPFIGRESEVLLLSHTLDRIRKGFQPHGAWGSLWLIGGESGVGKTRLVREMRTRALVEGITVLEGSAVEGGGLPYQIWREPMRKLCLLADLSDEDAAVLKRLVPDIDTLLRRRVPELPDISDEMAWAHLVATIARVLHQTSEPMLLILEDIHWAGRGLDVLNIVSELIAYRPMMILATYRTEEAPDLPDEFPRAHSITLDRFTDEEVEALVTAMLGGSTPQMLDLLRRETEGNPLFVVEAVRALAEEAGGLTAIDPTPQVLSVGGIRAMLRRRLDRVPPAARPLLKLSALLGRDIDRSLLEAGAKVLDLGPVDIDWWQVACSSAAVLEFHEGVARFAHDQLRATVIDGLTEAEHRDLHRAAAQALEAVYPDDPAWAATLLEHWQAAGEPLKESQYAVDAGEQALLVGENERAVSLLEQALDLLWKRTDLDMDAASALEIRLLRLLGDAHRALSHFERARTYYEACVDRATRVRNRQAVADALNGLGGLAYYEADYDRAAAHWQESLALRRMLNDEEGIASALGNLGLIADARGDLETALAYMAESVTRRRAIGEPRGLARSLNNQGITLYNHGAFAEAHAAFAEALEIAQSIGDRPTIAHVLNNLGLLQVDIGEFEHARSSHREALEIRRELGDKMLTAASLQNLGIVLLKQGAVETAQSHFEDAIAISEQVGDREGVALTTINLGQVALADSDYRRARAAFDNALVDLQAIANTPGIAEALIGLGRCAFDQRRVETAHRHFTDALTLAREMDARPLVAQALSALVPVHLALGERDQAEAVLQEGFALAWELGALPLALDLLLGAAQLSLERGDGERAGAYAALVERHPATERDTRMRLTRVRLQLIGTLDSRAMARATQRGMLLDLDEAAADLIGSVV